jgi:hypothetical protein
MPFMLAILLLFVFTTLTAQPLMDKTVTVGKKTAPGPMEKLTL